MMNLANSNLVSCTFFNNTASALGYLSAINNGFLSIGNKATILNCLFINNTAFSSSSFACILYSVSDFSTENCSFIDNNFLNGSDFYLTISTNIRNLTINNCLFERKNYKISNNGCFIYILNTINNTFPYKFTNNRIIILNTNQFYIFNGNIKNTSKIKWTFENNCLFVYNSNFFKNSSLNLYDETGNNLVLFKDAFNEVCDYPTFLFTESKMFTESQQFSRSTHFSQSFDFTRSIEFTQTVEFSKTNEFSYTSDFSESKKFTKLDEFIPTMEFSRSNINIYQSDYSNSNELSQFDSFHSNKPSQYDTYSTSFSSGYSFNSITFISDPIIFDKDPTSSPRKVSPGVIAGIVIALIALILATAIIIYFILKKEKKSSGQENTNKMVEETTANAITNSKPMNYDDEDNDINFWL